MRVLMKIAFYTLGCKVNQYDTQAVTERFAAKGFETVGYYMDADVYVVNSCTVTAESDRKTRQAVRRFKKLHPDSVVVLTGCMPQAFPNTADELPEADIILTMMNCSVCLNNTFPAGTDRYRLHPTPQMLFLQAVASKVLKSEQEPL